MLMLLTFAKEWHSKILNTIKLCSKHGESCDTLTGTCPLCLHRSPPDLPWYWSWGSGTVDEPHGRTPSGWQGEGHTSCWGHVEHLKFTEGRCTICSVENEVQCYQPDWWKIWNANLINKYWKRMIEFYAAYTSLHYHKLTEFSNFVIESSRLHKKLPMKL